MFGVPAFVMSRLPGRGYIVPSNRDGWLRQLADTLLALHRTPTDGLDLSFLPEPGLEIEREQPDAADEKARRHPDGPAMLAALRTWRRRLPAIPAVLTHGDYWPGNTLWHRRRLTAVIDWDDARLGPPGADVGYCRTDLALMLGQEAADRFLDLYESAAGARIQALFVWDLAGAWHALPDPAPWVAGYHDLGRTDLTVDLVRARLRAFIADALGRAASAEEARLNTGARG
jgi:aminoglycoside phosphotransferase (APT) family kinase protein